VRFLGPFSQEKHLPTTYIAQDWINDRVYVNRDEDLNKKYDLIKRFLGYAWKSTNDFSKQVSKNALKLSSLSKFNSRTTRVNQSDCRSL